MSLVGAVITAGPDRESNLKMVVAALGRMSSRRTAPLPIMIVTDGWATDGWEWDLAAVGSFPIPKHEPGHEQPRNVGVRRALKLWPELTHVWFLDSDVMPQPEALDELELAIAGVPHPAIVVAPYDWLGAGVRPEDGLEQFYSAAAGVFNDQRWPMFRASNRGMVYNDAANAGLACWSGNLVWPIREFMEVGGFWNELFHGRCEDGELGLRAVAKGVPITFAAEARGYHLWHPRDDAEIERRNTIDVPKLNARHKRWLDDLGILLAERDGMAFDTRCPGCGLYVPTGDWWNHAEGCGVLP